MDHNRKRKQSVVFLFALILFIIPIIVINNLSDPPFFGELYDNRELYGWLSMIMSFLSVALAIYCGINGFFKIMVLPILSGAIYAMLKFFVAFVVLSSLH